MSVKNSYFEFPSLYALIERRLHPESCQHELTLRGKPLRVSWTRRAERALARRSQPLLAEMQLYFSCVVKKRVLFHEAAPGGVVESVAVSDQLHVAFRPVEANSCDPLEFAANHPERREFASSAALRMHPSHLHLDYKKGGWVGEFEV